MEHKDGTGGAALTMSADDLFVARTGMQNSATV